MPSSRQRSVMASPSINRATNRRRSSMTEHSLHGIDTSRQEAKSVTHVSGTKCHLCLGLLKMVLYENTVLVSFALLATSIGNGRLSWRQATLNLTHGSRLRSSTSVAQFCPMGFPDCPP